MFRKVIIGQDVADKVALLRSIVVKSNDIEYISRFQTLADIIGYREAELVESDDGWSVRHASGLQDFALISSSRAGQVDSSFEGAVAAAKLWADYDPKHRYVTLWE